MGQPTPHRLDLYHVDRLLLILCYFLTSTMMSRPTCNFVWLYHTSIGCYNSYSQGE